MIFLNFKTYESGTGKGAIRMAKIADEVCNQSGVKIVSVVQPSDIRGIAIEISNEVWVQKIDPVEYGANTGAILAEAVVGSGAVGTFLNHSESRLTSFENLSKAQERARAVGLKTLIFAKDIEELKKVVLLKPDFVAYEPPEFIGNASVSVVSAKPDIVIQAVDVAREFKIPLIVGAGVHSAEDVKKSLEFGAAGVAVASDVMKAFDPKKELLDLVEGFK